MTTKPTNDRARSAMLERNRLREEEQGVQSKKETSTTIHAKVFRADGTVEGDRMIAYGHINPLIHYALSPLVYFNGWFWNQFYELRSKLRNRRKTAS